MDRLGPEGSTNTQDITRSKLPMVIYPLRQIQIKTTNLPKPTSSSIHSKLMVMDLLPIPNSPPKPHLQKTKKGRYTYYKTRFSEICQIRPIYHKDLKTNTYILQTFHRFKDGDNVHDINLKYLFRKFIQSSYYFCCKAIFTLFQVDCSVAFHMRSLQHVEY
jgi:hypothetical protein